MTRPVGFAIADHDVRFLQDPRILRVTRTAGAPAVLAYIAVRDASWADGERAQLGEVLDALPAAYRLELDEVLEPLVGVGLLDEDGRIPAATWDAWYGPADARRDARRESGRLGGLRSGEARRAKQTRSDAVATVPETRSKREPDRPSVVATNVATDGRPSSQTPPDTAVDCRRPDVHPSTAWFRKPAGTYKRSQPAWYCELCVAEDKTTAPGLRERVAWHS